jgi:hypothetical protein
VSVSVAYTNSAIDDHIFNGGDANVIFEVDSRLLWFDGNTDPSWLRVDFVRHRVQVTSYSINIGNSTCHRCNPIQGVLEGSNDGESWTKRHVREKISMLKHLCVEVVLAYPKLVTFEETIIIWESQIGTLRVGILWGLDFHLLN